MVAKAWSKVRAKHEPLEFIRHVYRSERAKAQLGRQKIDELKIRDRMVPTVTWFLNVSDKKAIELMDEAIAPPNPYPGEWSARQLPTSEFVRFRRKEVAPGVSFVFGFPHPRRRKPGRGESEVQSVRLSKDHFTKAQALAWLKKHEFRTRIE